MNTIEDIKIYLLYPYGFEISDKVSYEIDFFTPYREITHPDHKGKVFKFTPEFVQEIHSFGRGYLDTIPILEKELMKVFGKDVFFSRNVYFPNYKPDFKRVGEKRVFTISLESIPEEDVAAYVKYIENRLKKPLEIKKKNERQEIAISSIDSIKKTIEMMVNEGDIKHIAKVFLFNYLDNLELQITNINEPFKEIEK